MQQQQQQQQQQKTNSELRSALGRVYLQAGQLDQAEAHLAAVAADPSAPEPTKALNAAFSLLRVGTGIRPASSCAGSSSYRTT